MEEMTEQLREGELQQVAEAGTDAAVGGTMTMADLQLTNKVEYLHFLLHTPALLFGSQDKHSSSLPQQAVCTSWPLLPKLVSLIWNSVVQSRTVMYVVVLLVYRSSEFD